MIEVSHIPVANFNGNFILYFDISQSLQENQTASVLIRSKKDSDDNFRKLVTFTAKIWPHCFFV